MTISVRTYTVYTLHLGDPHVRTAARFRKVTHLHSTVWEGLAARLLAQATGHSAPQNFWGLQRMLKPFNSDQNVHDTTIGVKNAPSNSRIETTGADFFQCV